MAAPMPPPAHCSAWIKCMHYTPQEKSLTHSIPLAKPHLSEQFGIRRTQLIILYSTSFFFLVGHMNFSRTISVKVGTVTCTVTSTAAMLFKWVRILPDLAKSDAHWFDILLPALIALGSVTHTASYGVAVSAFAFKFARTNLFPLWNRFSHFLALDTHWLRFFVRNSFPPTMLAALKLAEWETMATTLRHARLSSFLLLIGCRKSLRSYLYRTFSDWLYKVAYKFCLIRQYSCTIREYNKYE